MTSLHTKSRHRQESMNMTFEPPHRADPHHKMETSLAKDKLLEEVNEKGDSVVVWTVS